MILTYKNYKIKALKYSLPIKLYLSAKFAINYILDMTNCL